MHILFVGVFNTPHSNNHPQVAALKKKGHKVTTFDYRATASTNRSPLAQNFIKYRRIAKVSWSPKSIKRRFYLEPGRRYMMHQLMQQVTENKYDLIFLSKIEEIDYKLIEQLNKHAPTYYYFMDPLRGAQRMEAHEYASRATYASATFSDVTAQFNQYGANAKQIVQGIDPKQYETCQDEPDKFYDVVFAGTIDTYRSRFIKLLEDNGIDVTLFGKGTKNGPRYNEDLMCVYNQSKIILNLTRPGTGFSIRVFEAMASGSLLLTQYCDDLELFFNRGEHLDWFHTAQEAEELINYYLNHPNKCEEIANQGKQLVREKYTWDDQIERVLDFIENS